MKLGPFPLLVYNALSFHANRNQQVFCSQSLLAKELGISSRQCQRALQVLQAHQLITVDHTKRRGKTNIYTLLPIQKRDTTDSQGDTTDTPTLSQETDSKPVSIGELCVASFPNKTSKQNNTTKLDEQKGPPEADKSSFQEGEEQNPTASPGLQSGGNEAPCVSAGRNESPERVAPDGIVLTKEMTDLIEDIQNWSRWYCRANEMDVPAERTALWAGYHIQRLGVAKVRRIFEEEANAQSPCLDRFWKALKAARAENPKSKTQIPNF